jgi:subfamily B ATP-binding cassette protein MsbA
MLGDNGANISGGQRQRISIAREFFKEPPILILDEATSALDTETEQIIQQSIDEQKGKKTIIVIAHRLSTIRHCDKIFVMDRGRIAESGTYDELISRKGLFREMTERQGL